MTPSQDHLFKTVFDKSSAPTVILRADAPYYTIVFDNELHKKATNTIGKDLIGKSVREIFTPGNDVDKLMAGIADAIARQQSVELPVFRFQISTDADPSVKSWWRTEITPLWNDDKEVEYLILTLHNVTLEEAARSAADEGEHREQELSEELAASNEEVVAANEELNATNEELASTNEELVLSQQKLQKLNEELEERVAQRTKALVESEMRFRAMVELSPVAMLVTRGENMVFETINPPMLELIGRDQSVRGKPWFEAIPELEGQPIMDRLYHTFRSGEEWSGNEQPIILRRPGKPDLGYFDISYKPIVEDGKTVGVLQSAIDVTDQVVSRRKIEQSEMSLRTLVMTARYALMILRGPEWTIEIANQQIANLWNKPLDTITGFRLMEVLPELEGQPFPQLLKKVYDTGEGYGQQEEEFFVSSPNGQVKKYVSFYYDPIFDSNGEVNGIVVASNDITEIVNTRKLLEKSEEEQQSLNEELTATNEELAVTNEELITSNEELETTQQNLTDLFNKLSENEARLRYMLADAPVAIAVFTGRELVIESANKKVLEAWGKTSDIVGKTLQNAIPELLGQQFLQLLDNVFITGEPYYGNEVKALLEQNGKIEEIYSNFVYQPLKNDEGETIAIMMVAILVTEQVLARKKVEQAEEMLRFSVEAANVGTWFLDLKTKEFVPSPRLKELYGFNRDEKVLYEDAVTRVPEEYRHKVEAAIQKAITKGEVYNLEHPVIGFHDRKVRWVRALGRLNANLSGEPSHFSGVSMDITEQKQDELRKNDFIGMVSHELKTPLTSLNAYAQMLHAKAKKEEDTFTAGALEKVTVQVKKMTNMINGFLNVSRLESGKIHVHKEDFNLDGLIKDMIDDTNLTVASHNITLKPCEPVIVHADRDKIASVITNLLSNAIKYSPKGKNIEIKCHVHDKVAEVSVKDEGIGINPQDIEKLFDRYYRVESQHTHTISGFGIGLYVSAEIVERHDGKIWVDSRPGEGSTFYFSLPL